LVCKVAKKKTKYIELTPNSEALVPSNDGYGPYRIILASTDDPMDRIPGKWSTKT
jgi:hypothetical protein